MLQIFEKTTEREELTPEVVAAALSACATETLLLNSERIEQRFGSYGVEVLASEAGLRRSSLYSIEGDERVCRTYAIVRFKNDPQQNFGPEHANVMAGNSLGNVFKANDWSIHKQTLHIGSFELDAPGSEVAKLMHEEEPTRLSLHVYQLILVRDSRVFEYATIAEAHHSDYLSLSDLLEIYDYDDSESLPASSLARLIELLRSKNAS